MKLHKNNIKNFKELISLLHYDLFPKTGFCYNYICSYIFTLI
ncbi:hypothetical protein BN1088_1780003 [Sphingobacterium sp. PM2-P1-29]|nr:hypothetical protein BN1088_1780003 [Sphingobacterium sp. PM2-P1-29]